MHGAIPPFHMSSFRCGKLSMQYVFMAWYLFKYRDNFTLSKNGYSLTLNVMPPVENRISVVLTNSVSDVGVSGFET
jgi:hypothetical protein